ncbi:MAG: DUF5686 and carboxypeptidase regulatory-like domain-containing protein [Bacteroidetes bacterium]|nr:DUF5686 and carboxypeptidase regulatory-like domain-containing protein [Bacteroidota bacterium]
MKSISLFLFIFIFSQTSFAQEYFIRGKVQDKVSQMLLPYANIRIENSSAGTTTNKSGQYELKLSRGEYKLITSYIGYNSDTISVKLNGNLSKINFSLTQTEINLPAITIRPGVNPALEIIRKAIARKEERNKKLLSYKFEAYTKGIVKTQKDFTASGRQVSLGIGSDTSALKITGILENESKGYYKSPDYYKEIITARKQSSNLPSFVNTLSGGGIVQDLYKDEFNFLGANLLGPLAKNALSYYDFYIKNTLAIDKKKVYEIFMEPQNQSDPGFKGNIFITDETFDLIKVDLRINKAASVGGLFDSVNVFQQFSLFKDSIYMPIDLRLFIKLNYLGIAKLAFELNTILYDYKINPEISDDFFNKAILSVLPDADKKDSLYWQNAQTIPNTNDEQAAYERIDSVSKIQEKFHFKFSPLSSRIDLSENFSVSAPLAMYHFNRVEGHAIDFGLFLSQANDLRLNSSLQLSYGFSDKKIKSDFNASYLFGDYRTYKISFDAFNKVNVLFGNNYNDLTTSILALSAKDDFSDYYYSKGFNLQTSGEVLPFLRLNAGFSNHTDNSAIKNTNFSFFAKNKSYLLNQPIFETKINALTAGFTLDFRDYIEDGYFRRRMSFGNSFAVLNGSVAFSNSGILKSDVDFTSYYLSSWGTLNTAGSTALNFRLSSMYTNGERPYQLLYSLPGNIDFTSRNFTFRTLDINEILGDRILTLNLQENLGSKLFRLLRVPGLKDWDIQLNTFLNAAYSTISNGSKSILVAPVKSFTHPFYEIGFGIGHPLIPLELDFAWRLNYRGENNFRIGINTFIIQ